MMALLDTRHGLPIALSILYVGVARKVGWRATALGVPGHVLIRIGDEPGAVFQDPFDEGRVLDSRGLKRVLARVLGANATPDPAYLAPMDNRATLIRLLTNQAARARRLGDLERALVLHERMTAFAPFATALWWERARLEQHLGRLSAARGSLVAIARDDAGWGDAGADRGGAERAGEVGELGPLYRRALRYMYRCGRPRRCRYPSACRPMSMTAWRHCRR